MSANSCPISIDSTAAPGTESLCWSTGGFANITIEISGIAGGVLYDVVANPGGVILQTISIDGVYPFVVSAYSRVCLVINTSGTGIATVNALLFNKMSFSENSCSIDFDATATPPQTVNCWDVIDKATFVLEVTGLAGGAEYEVQANPGGVVLQTITVDGSYIFDVSIYAEICVVLTVSGTGTTSFDAFLFTVIGTGTSHNILLDNGPPSDDHPQYLHLPGRAGGQVAHGGTAAGEELELRGSTDADRGIVRLSSPIEIDYDYTDTPFLQYIDFQPVIPSSGLAVGGFITSRPDITVDSGVFIFATVRDLGIYRQTVTPGFAVHAVFLGQPRMFTDTPGVQPNQTFMFASQAQYENDGAGNVVTPITNIIGLVHTPQLIVRNSGDQLRATNITGMQVGANYSTVGGSTIAFGIIRGLLMVNPAQGLFQPGGGAESMTAYYGVDVPAIPFGGNVFKTALRSALVDATNTRFIWNIGTAQAEFGNGHIHLNDNTLAKFGNTTLLPDAGIFWNGTNLIIDSAVNGFGKVEIPSNGLIVAGDSFPVSDFIRRSAATNLLLSAWRLTGITPNDMADGFGTTMFWSIEDDTSGRVNIAFQSAERAGADNTGRYRLWVYDAGVPRQVYTARRNTMTITSRALVEGALAVAPISPAQITTDVDDYQGQGLYTAMRGVLRLSTDASRIMSGIDATTVDYSEAGDILWLINIGSFDLVLGHQDTGSIAANRIISPTAVDLILGPDESAMLWYDGATARWRILETTGA